MLITSVVLRIRFRLISAKKQQAIADNFRSVANKIQIDQKQAEVKASREIESNARKYKVDDITNQDVEDDGADGVSSLF